jgi:hypothetical protein
VKNGVALTTALVLSFAWLAAARGTEAPPTTQSKPAPKKPGLLSKIKAKLKEGIKKIAEPLARCGAPDPKKVCPATPPGHSTLAPALKSHGVCRGACGGGCHEKACTAGTHTLCVEARDACGKTYQVSCTYSTMSCGSHAGCVEHDACLDRYAEEMGESTSLTRKLMLEKGQLKCHADCIAKYGISNCAAWAIGRGPKTSQLLFAKPVSDSSVRAGSCRSGTASK